MKRIIVIGLLLFAFMSGNGQIQTCISKIDAERILGRPALQTMQNEEDSGSVKVFRCAYSMVRPENTTGPESNLYFMFEEYEKITAAEKTFAVIVSQNTGMRGFHQLPGFGDEAILQTDNRNFQLIIVRKSGKIIRIKVNRITSTTSMDAMKAITKGIVESM